MSQNVVKTFVAITLAALLTSCASGRRNNWTAEARQNHPFGFFAGTIETRWNRDGRTMTMLSDFKYTDPKGEVWTAPAGSEVDGASIPRALWSFMGGPFEGKYRNASVLHDVSYDQHNRPWQDCDRMFYNAMRCSGVGPVQAKTMYYSLVRFGRHWNFSIKRATAATIDEAASGLGNPDDIHDVAEWIRNGDPSIEQIEHRAEQH